MNVANPDFFRRVSELVATTPLADWRAYLRYHALSQASPWLSAPVRERGFRLLVALHAARRSCCRDGSAALRETDRRMGEALGQAYVTRTFPPEARARAKAVIDDIRAAFARATDAS